MVACADALFGKNITDFAYGDCLDAVLLQVIKDSRAGRQHRKIFALPGADKLAWFACKRSGDHPADMICIADFSGFFTDRIEFFDAYNIRITSYNVCYTKLLRPTAIRRILW